LIPKRQRGASANGVRLHPVRRLRIVSPHAAQETAGDSKRRPAPSFHSTDLGNAARFARDHRDHARFCGPLGWLVWDGRRWHRDNTGAVERLARRTVREIYRAVAVTTNDEERTELVKWAHQSESHQRIKALLALARSEDDLIVETADLDTNPWLLNTASGIVDLTTGRVQSSDPDAHMTKLAATNYEPKARCPTWTTFLDKIMKGRAELIDFLQRAIGYSLTGATREQCFFVLHGTGENGKTTFLEALRGVLGDYATNAAPETFMVRVDAGPRGDVARLRGARFVSTVETEDGRRLAEGLVKQLTGGDTLTARYLYHAEFEFRPQFKLWMASNHKPIIRGTDHAIWRRVRLIPFDVTISRAKRDKTLAEKLMAESAGILAWAVEGCLQWQKKGLGEPAVVDAATAAYREEMDYIGTFIKDRCIVAEGRKIPSGELYGAYREWAERSGEDTLTAKTFSLRLKARGFRGRHERTGSVILGIGLSKHARPDV